MHQKVGPIFWSDFIVFVCVLKFDSCRISDIIEVYVY